jgi:RNA polymerase sigma-70 factor (ECF subfamily)
MIETDVRAQLERLAPLAAVGDEEAVEEILRIAHPVVHRYCTSRLESVEHPQDVSLALMSALRTYRDEGKSLLSFIFGIAAHKVSDARRRANRLSVPTAQSATAHHTVDIDEGPEHHVLRAELRGEMDELVQTLPVRHQQIVFMRIVVGMSAEQTARVLDTTPGAIRVAQHRALAHLRSRIHASHSIAG